MAGRRGEEVDERSGAERKRLVGGRGVAQERQASGARRAAEEEAYEGDDRHREIDDEVGVHFEQSCSLSHLSDQIPV